MDLSIFNRQLFTHTNRKKKKKKQNRQTKKNKKKKGRRREIENLDDPERREDQNFKSKFLFGANFFFPSPRLQTDVIDDDSIPHN